MVAVFLYVPEGLFGRFAVFVSSLDARRRRAATVLSREVRP